MTVTTVLNILKSIFLYLDNHKVILFILLLMLTLTIGAGLATLLYLLRKWRESTWGWFKCRVNMDGKVVIITGGNSGIGLETAKALANMGAVVILGCRNITAAQKVISDARQTLSSGELILMELDLEDYESICKFAERFQQKYQKLDVLINNAGVYYPPQNPPKISNYGVEIHFAINHLGHFALTQLLFDIVTKTPQSRVLIVSSELYRGAQLDLNDLTLTRSLALDKKRRQNVFYNNSKLANLLHARELNYRMKGKGVTVCSLSPGFTYTGLFRHSLSRYAWLKKIAFLPIAFFFMRSTLQGAQTSIFCSCSEKVQPTEKALFYRNVASEPLLPLAEDDEKAKQLWKMSEEMLSKSSSKLENLFLVQRGLKEIR